MTLFMTIKNVTLSTTLDALISAMASKKYLYNSSLQKQFNIQVSGAATVPEAYRRH
jgi:hypothetical protein